MISDLIENTKSERLRRDISQLLVAIKVHALLHRKHRKRSTKGSIVATIKDYAAVRELMGDLLATASEVKTRVVIEQTVAAVGVVAQRRADPNTEGATVREIAAELSLDRSAAQRRLKAAEGEGCIANLEERKGHPARYRIPTIGVGAGMPVNTWVRSCYRRPRPCVAPINRQRRSLMSPRKTVHSLHR